MKKITIYEAKKFVLSSNKKLPFTLKDIEYFVKRYSLCDGDVFGYINESKTKFKAKKYV